MGRISRWEIEELAAHIICDNNESAAEEMLENEDIENALCDRYEIDFEQFSAIVEDLIRYTPALESSLSKERYHALGIEDVHGFRAIVKQEVE